MEKEKSVKDVIERLKKRTSKRKKGTSKKKNRAPYYKRKDGRNNLLFIPDKKLGDPFLELGTHEGLMTPSWKSIHCNTYNKGGKCLICDVVNTLKEDDFVGNKDMWSPISMKTKFYSPVIDLDDIDAGIQWYNYPKTVSGYFTAWLESLDEGEMPFYDFEENPTKVIVYYDKEAEASLKYKLDKKPLKLSKEDKEKIVKLMKNIPSFEDEILVDYYKDDKVSEIISDYLSSFEEKNDVDDDAKTDDGEDYSTKDEEELPY